jgi:uncharacterized protein
MTTYFADTFYYLALLNPGDAAHAKAIECSLNLAGPSLTTAWVLTEVADAMADPAQRGTFLAFLQDLKLNPRVTIIPPTPALFDAGLELFAKRPDKEWSLTDCISFVVMRDHGLTDALTADNHFKQAGFNILLK